MASTEFESDREGSLRRALPILPRRSARDHRYSTDRDEDITKDMAATWMRAASNPKTEKVYSCDHAFNLAAFFDRADFLKRQIGIYPIDPAALRGKTTLLPHADLARYATYQRNVAARKEAESQR